MEVGGTLVNVWILVAAALFAVVVVLVVVFIVRITRRAIVSRHDPLSSHTDVDGSVVQRDLFANGQSKAQRLTEIDSLLANGVITSHEHARARAAVLRD